MNNFYKFAEEAIETAGKTGERKRQFRAQTASDLARSRMAELERSETGATKRQVMLEAGKESRHLRQYGPEGTATQRLSWVKEQATKEKAAKDFTTRAGGIMGKYISKDVAGNEILDPRLGAAFKRAKALGIDDSEAGLSYLSNAVKFLEGQGKGVGKDAGEDIGKQAPRLSAKSIEEQLPRLSMEDVSLMETAGFITPEKAQELKERELLQQRLTSFMPEEAIVPQTRGAIYYDLLHGRSQRLGEMR